VTDQYVVTLLDSTGIQNYIFGSNRLRENIGASELVRRATSTFVEKALQEAINEHHDLHDLSQASPIEENPDRRAEGLFQGGGNVALLFRTLDDAKATVRELSRILLENAPGLEVAAVHSDPFDWNTSHLADIDTTPGLMTRLYEKMVQYKQQRARSAPLASLGVTLDCRATGLPATCIFTDPDDVPLPISAETSAKITWREKASERLKRELLPETLQQSYALPDRFDHLGRSHGEVSYLAVVHADGNGIGKRIQDTGRGKEDNRTYIQEVRQLSAAINSAGMQALCKTIKAMEAMLCQQQPGTEPQMDVQPSHFAYLAYLEEVGKFVFDLSQDKKSKKRFLPFRPLVYGGDDVTFVCDGRLGLALAVYYLQQFEKESTNLPGGPAYACAGVAIVKTHYPFARAYNLAEDLCRSAKRFVREQKEAGKGDGSAIDWHIAASGRGDSISAIREREYKTHNDDLLSLRPLLCTRQDDSLRTWWVVEQAAWQLKYTNSWRERRNKVMALRETLRQGRENVAQFLTRYGLAQLPELDTDQPGESRKNGFHNGRCLYFDAIEALDIFLPLAPVEPLE
jgi:hypothetical protein